MPCCHLTPPGPFAAGFTADARRFSKYIGGAWPIPALAPGGGLLSALHVDLRLWTTGKRLAQPYLANDAMDNSWKVARPRLTNDMFIGHPAEREAVKELVRSLPGMSSNPCALAPYDRWILERIAAIRTAGRGLGGGGGPGEPTALSTVGMAQKILNVYWKYQACWHVGGTWNAGAGAFVSSPNAAGAVLCALHCPIDSILLEAVRDKLTLGSWLRERGLMDAQAHLRQADASFSPWSKLDCIRAYFGLQLMLRRIAMHTWPKGCGCSGQDGLAGVPEAVLPRPSRSGARVVPDWIEEAFNLPEKVIAKTAGELMASVGEQEATGGTEESQTRKSNALGKVVTPVSREIEKSYTNMNKAANTTTGGVPRSRDIKVKKQKSFKSLKWQCEDHFNAGALSFDNAKFRGRCYVNSVARHSGGDEALWEQIRDNGHNFMGPGFTPSPDGAVAGVGNGTSYLGYRTFASEAEAKKYLASVGVPPTDC
jgi:hypothetical protein